MHNKMYYTVPKKNFFLFLILFGIYRENKTFYFKM